MITLGLSIVDCRLMIDYQSTIINPGAILQEGKMRNSPGSILIFMLTSLFFVCTAQSQAIIDKHQDLPQWSPDGGKYACVETWLNEEKILESQIRIYRVSGKTETEVAAELFGLGDLAEEKLPEGTVDDDPIVCFFSWAPDSEHYQ